MRFQSRSARALMLTTSVSARPHVVGDQVKMNQETVAPRKARAYLGQITDVPHLATPKHLPGFAPLQPERLRYERTFRPTSSSDLRNGLRFQRGSEESERDGPHCCREGGQNEGAH